jgi:hypothetical protein
VLAVLALLAWLATLTGLLIAALLLLAGLLPAALLTRLLAGLLAGLIALLLLARFLVGILVLLIHLVFLQRCWRLRLEDYLRDSPAKIITPRQRLRSVCNGARNSRRFSEFPSLYSTRIGGLRSWDAIYCFGCSEFHSQF